jgi:8-oxo-dGTP diphosphatase
MNMEYLDIRTEDGKVTGEVKERTQVHIDGDIHGTSHVWLVRHTDRENGRFDILLQKRAMTGDIYSGCYDISAAGHILAGNDYIDCAVRELEEELGIHAEASQMKFVGLNEGMMEAVAGGRQFKNHEVSAVYIYDEPLDDKDFRLQKEEVESVVWIDFDECKAKLHAGEIKNGIFESEFKMLEEFIRHRS